MSAIYTHKQRIDLLTQVVSIIDFCISRVSAAISYKNNHLVNTRVSVVSGEAYIKNGYLKSLGALLGTHLVGVYTLLATNIDTWMVKLFPGMLFPKFVGSDIEFPAFHIDNANSGYSLLFSTNRLIDILLTEPFNTGDIVEVINAEDSDNDGFYTVDDTPLDISIQLSPQMTGIATRADTNLTITLIER